jgi:membrane protease YdiL (CAAX protease family)
LAGYLGMTTLSTVVRRLLSGSHPELAHGMAGPAVIQTISGLAVYGILTFLIGRRALRLDWAELGWPAPKEGARGFGRGMVLAIGVGVVALATGVVGGSGWSRDGGAFGSYLGQLVLLVVILGPPAFLEELAFRGVALAGMAKGIGRAPGLLATSVLFATAHWGNPNVSVLALGNITLAGVFLGLTFFARGGIWTATGAHLGWNFILAALGAPVSGLPFEVPWLDWNPGRIEWLTGGSFGPEGGLLGTVALTIGILIVGRKLRGGAGGSPP